MPVRGVNHITMAVRDLERSLIFYRGVLGLELAARWPDGAYLRGGALWLTLLFDAEVRRGPRPEYSHVAFTVDDEDLPDFLERVEVAGAQLWQDDYTEGASVYIVDPDGHKLELHVGSLDTRLAEARRNPWDGLELYEEDE